MQAAALARRAIAVALTAGACLAGTACSSGDDRVAPDASIPVPPPTVVVTDAGTTTTQVPAAATPLVRQAVLDYWAAQQRCQDRPQSCRPATFTAEQGTIRADVQSALQTLIDNGWHRATPGTDDPGGGYVAVLAVTIADDGITATTDECVYDPAPLMSAAGVVSDVAIPHRFVHTLYLEDGTWKVGDEQVDTSTACDDTPDSIPLDTTTPIT
ncbi:MAG: hypothetical protein QM733_01920 [Ilumatobacteraceae bacterium]